MNKPEIGTRYMEIGPGHCSGEFLETDEYYDVRTRQWYPMGPHCKTFYHEIPVSALPTIRRKLPIESLGTAHCIAMNKFVPNSAGEIAIVMPHEAIGKKFTFRVVEITDSQNSCSE